MRKWTVFLFCTLLVLVACQSEMDKYYELPDTLKGNAWEVLRERGNFRLFLSAVEKTSYKGMIQGKGLITVMAPTDEAFKKYLSDKGYSSVDDIPALELEKLIAYHIVYYSYDKGSFANYKPEGVDAINYQPGKYYKFRTKSSDAIETMKDFTADGVSRQVIHKDRYLPVFSHNLFISNKIEARANYEYFYPNSTWNGDDGFNISNASVTEYEVITDNGYLYIVDQVIEPLNTIYSELQKATDFSDFAAAYERFATFEFDEDATTSNISGDSLYIHSHKSLPPIASEWTNMILGNNTNADYTQLANLSSRTFNIFAPDNISLQAFFNKYWSPSYATLADVDFLPLLSLLENHVASGNLLFPQIIERGDVLTTFGTPITFNRESAKLKQMCANGTLYGLNHVIVPPMFTKVTAPMFCKREYRMILDMMIYSNLYVSLLTEANQFKVFYPTDDMIEKNTTLEGKSMKYINTNAKKFGAQEVQIEGDDGFGAMKISQKTMLAGNHIAAKLMTDAGDGSIYRTLNSYNYLLVKGDKVYSTSSFNIGSTPASFISEGKYSNGEAYALKGDVSALTPESNQFKTVIASKTACPTDYSYFNKLIGASGLATMLPAFSFLQGNRFITLIPTDEVIKANIKKIPSRPASAVADFLKTYFINVSSSNLLDYPFAGAGVRGKITSFGFTSDGKTHSQFELIDTGSGLKIRDMKGNEVNVISYFPRIYSDGAAYLIDGLLEVE